MLRAIGELLGAVRADYALHPMPAKRRAGPIYMVPAVVVGRDGPQLEKDVNVSCTIDRPALISVKGCPVNAYCICRQ
jgi:hypothetical protein